MKNCPKCGKELKDEAKFCGGCGYKFPVADAATAGSTCPKCGNPLKPGAKFCGKCGSKLEGTAVDSANSSAEAQGKDFSLVGQFIHWNILPGQLAVKIDEHDIEAYGKVKGLQIQDGVKALFFVEGKLIAELDSGSYTFKDLGAADVKKEVVVSNPVDASQETLPTVKKGSGKRNVFGNFINSISSFFRGGHRQRAENAGLTTRISASVPPVSIVLVRTIDFPLMFTFDDVPTANLKTKVALHVLCKISNINLFYQSQLLDNKFVSFEKFSKNIEPIVQGVLSSAFTTISCDAISHNADVSNQILQILQDKIGTIYPFMKFSQIISLTAHNEEIENIHRMREELYVSEQELVELSRRNDFLNRMNNETNQQLLAEARTKVDFDAAMAKIDEDNELNKDEREKFALMLAAQKKLREAKTEDEVQAALQDFKKSDMLRAEELDNLEKQISHNANLRDLGNSQMIALATMQNQMELDKQRLEWEMSVGNKRIENQITQRRMQDEYADERARKEAEYSDSRRKAEMDLDKEEQLNQLEMLRQAQQIRQEREDAEHRRDVENQRLKMEAEKQQLDANVETQRIYSNMSAEQIMAANPNITPEAAAAMAEKFKAEAATAANDKTSDLLQQQNAQMMAFMSQQMAAVRDMSMAMSGAQSGLKDQLLYERQAEIERVRSDSERNQDRMLSNVNTTATAVAGALKAAPGVSVGGVGTVPVAPVAPVSSAPVADAKVVEAEKKCPSCGTLNEPDALFCEGCGEQL